MKTLLTFMTVLLLMTAVLYPLFTSGIGLPLWWPLEGGCIVGGLWGYYLLIKYRRQW
jgi:K+-transporting ATPase c subunit